jgi:nanoRNase/pAp phosphatase (c-di-AMP/oligoRNAs hydrolase)
MPMRALVQAGMQDDTKRKVSIRGKGDVDTTVISKHYGGGGHALASSSVMSADEVASWVCS